MHTATIPLLFILVLSIISLSKSLNVENASIKLKVSGNGNGKANIYSEKRAIVCYADFQNEEESPKNFVPAVINYKYSLDRRKAMTGMTGVVASNLIISPFPALASSSSMSSLLSSTTENTNFVVPTPADSASMYWPLGKVAFSLLPLAGTSTRRATLETNIIENTIWTHDQIQGIVNVNVPVRQTVIRLKGDGLWVHNPVAPTPQLLRMMKNLEKKIRTCSTYCVRYCSFRA